jgi:hypothetical protein
LRRVVSRQGIDLLIVYMACQSVAAQDENVARFHRPVDHLEFGIVVHANSARDDVASRPGLGFLGREFAFADQQLRLGMIHRDLLNPRRTDAIDPAVTRPHAGKELPVNQEDRDRGADQLPVAFLGYLPQATIGAHHPCFATGQKFGG